MLNLWGIGLQVLALQGFKKVDTHTNMNTDRLEKRDMKTWAHGFPPPPACVELLFHLMNRINKTGLSCNNIDFFHNTSRNPHGTQI